MAYILYDKTSTVIKSKPYKTHAAAQAALTRMNQTWAKNNGKLGNEPDAPVFTMGIAESAYFHKHIEKTVIKTNLMSGQEYSEPVNTPIYLSPASETYWSS